MAPHRTLIADRGSGKIKCMKYESIADIFSAHEKIRGRFQEVVASVSEADEFAELAGKAWTIRQIVEHVSIVEFSMLRICTKLVGAAREAGKPFTGFSLSPGFGEKIAAIGNVKVEAPERVHPTGEVTIADSMERLDAATQPILDLRYDLEAFDGSELKFPHPFFGELTAAEWLVVRGGHESRHTAQIEGLLNELKK